MIDILFFILYADLKIKRRIVSCENMFPLQTTTTADIIAVKSAKKGTLFFITQNTWEKIENS